MMADKTYQMFIGGEWVDAADGKTFDDMNPYSGEVYAHLPSGKREDARRAIEAAQAAYDVKGEIIPADYPNAFFMAVRQPAGVVSCFGPFNVPYILCSRAFAMPVAYGNTAVLKPSEEASVTGGMLLAEIFEEAGLPPGVL